MKSLFERIFGPSTLYPPPPNTKPRMEHHVVDLNEFVPRIDVQRMLDNEGRSGWLLIAVQGGLPQAMVRYIFERRLP